MKYDEKRLSQICGQITAHYPVYGWLRPAGTALKRLTTYHVKGACKSPDEDIQKSF